MPTFNARTIFHRLPLCKHSVQWLGLVLALTCFFSTLPVGAAGAVYYVSPSGTDTNSGTSANAPFKTIQKAVDVAQAGSVINLATGVYLQDIQSRRNGTGSAPITIKGPADAVVKGGGSARIVLINHDYLTLDGFTLDGLFGSPTVATGYRDKLLYAIGTAPRDGVTGLKLLRMTFKNAGGECVRLRYFAQRNEIAGSRVGPCGIHDFKFPSTKKNGEGIYIGTAPEQRADGKNPTTDPDESNWNWVHDNTFDTQGNECVDVKEAATGNIIENNRCTGQKDPESGGLDSRGSGNIFRYNESFGNLGAGIRLGGDAESDGIKNEVYGNNIHDNKAGGIKVQRTPQTKVCGNPMSNNVGGNAVGTFAATINPTAPCSTASTVVSPSPSPSPSAGPSPSPSASPSPSPSASPATTSTTLNFVAAMDTYVNQGSPSSTCGQCATLPVSGGSGTGRQAFIKLDVTGLTAQPKSVKLRIVVGSGSSDGSDKGGDINLITNNTWTDAVTWNTKPALDGMRVATLGTVNPGQVVEVDVSTLVVGNGTYSFALSSNSINTVVYVSNNHSLASSRPQLVITP